jgi:two-component system alkaline phosphatase synthesis response regulator PhoP
MAQDPNQSEPAAPTPSEPQPTADSGEAPAAVVSPPVAPDGKPPEAVATRPDTAPSAGKILLVEDDQTMVKMYATKLLKENFQVEVASDGEQALEKVKSQKPGLVVLDLMIPKIGGMEVLAQLRADPKTRSLPVLILSNLSQDADIQKAKQLGVKEFLVKANFTPSQVVEKIKQYI